MFDGIGLGHRSQCPIAFGLLRIDLKGSLAVKDPTLGFPESFYEEELDQIILAQGVTSRDEYRVARRAGRGVVLTRGKRDAIWPVFEEYRARAES